MAVVVTAVGGLVGQVVKVSNLSQGLKSEGGDVLDGAVNTLTRTTASLSSDLSRRIDAMGLGLARPPETGGPQLLRPEQIGVGEAVNRALGQVMPFDGRQTLADVQAAGVARASTEAATGVERTATIGRNEATWMLDAQGRPVRAEATLREVFADLERSSAETRAQGEAADRGIEGDHGGHIIGHRFVKDQGLDNLFPQNGDFNISAYKTLENEMADWVEAGAEVRVTVDLLGGGDRPVRVRVAYEVLSAASGDVVYENTVLFGNEADRTFDRTSSSDMKTMLDG
ncbi:MAG: DNA/RNA non-specific endonuclease [Brevundimonas sp.]